jgi:hypothetical protein
MRLPGKILAKDMVQTLISEQQYLSLSPISKRCLILKYGLYDLGEVVAIANRYSTGMDNPSKRFIIACNFEGTGWENTRDALHDVFDTVAGRWPVMIGAIFSMMHGETTKLTQFAPYANKAMFQTQLFQTNPNWYTICKQCSAEAKALGLTPMFQVSVVAPNTVDSGVACARALVPLGETTSVYFGNASKWISNGKPALDGIR